MRPFKGVAGAACLASFALGCGDSTSAPRVRAVDVTPAVASLEPGQSQQFVAAARDGGGNVLAGRTATWTTGAPTLVGISATGLVTAVSPGSATITATVDGVSGMAEVTVRPVSVASVSVQPSPAALFVGDTQQLSATARDVKGTVLTGRAVTWTSNAPLVATVAASGAVTGVGAGSATISATIDGVTGSASFTVTLSAVTSVTISPASVALAVGQVQALFATPSDARGKAQAGRALAWSTAAPSVASVSASGVVTAVGAGATTITVVCEGISATASVTVVVAATLSAPAVLRAGAKTPTTSSVSGPAVWRVNGVVGGNAREGTVTAQGLYTAPALTPLHNPVMLTLQNGSVPGDSATVRIAITPAPLQGFWTVFEPRVVNVASTDSVVYLVHAPAGIDRVELAPASGGTARVFRPITGQLYQLNLAASQVLANYRSGDLHNFLGYIDFFQGATRLLRGNEFASVRDATVPGVSVTALAADAQVGSRVLNLKVDTMDTFGVALPTATNRMYQLLADDYDMVGIIQPVDFFMNRYHAVLRNAVAGIGLSPVNLGVPYGSAARLSGVTVYPVLYFFDLGELASIHEIGHQWINYLTIQPLAAGAPHWPISSVSHGVMGSNIQAGVGGSFPFDFAAGASGTYAMVAAADTGSFTDLDLYLMGLGPASAVPPTLVIDDQSQFTPLPALGSVVKGSVTVVTIEQIVAAQGARVPAFGQAPTTFRIGTIMLSMNRLLSADEMAFLEHMAARGESTVPLRYTSGFAEGMSKPFFVATRGRGRLVTTMH